MYVQIKLLYGRKFKLNYKFNDKSFASDYI